MKEAVYAIKDLEILSGIKMHTIRIWEKRYGLLTPNRTETNIRYYGDDDLRRLLNVSMLVKNGFKISKVASWSDEEIRDKVIEISKTKTGAADYIERFMLLLIEFDLAGFENLFNEVTGKYGFEEACSEVFFRLFERVGTYWQAGSVFPAQEHLVSNFYRQKLLVETDRLKVAAETAKAILFFLPEGEWHELGLLFYAYLAKKQGFRTIYLGQSVPFDDLARVNAKLELHSVFTSFVNPLSKEDLEDYLQQLKTVFSRQRVFITGLQVKEHNPALPRNFKTVKDYREFRKFLGSGPDAP